MDKNLMAAYELKLNHLKQACETCQYELSIVETKQEARQLVEQMVQSKMICSVGGSMTLFETGIIEMLEQRTDIHYLDRYHAENPQVVFHDSFNADIYITSTNALTVKGELYNIDGNGNRVAAMIYGPKKVVVVLGLNKLVENLEEAHARMKFITAPANNIRLSKTNPCTETGFCVDCRRPARLCCSEVTIKHSQTKGRIHLVIVKEELGY